MNKQEFNAGKKAYQQPQMKVVEIDSSDIICTSPDPSPRGRSNESYEEGNTDDWFNN